MRSSTDLRSVLLDHLPTSENLLLILLTFADSTSSELTYFDLEAIRRMGVI